MKQLNRRDLLALRCTALRLGSVATQSPAEVVRHLGALQGQDLPSALWAIGVRTPNATLSTVRDAFDRGELVRAWPFRGTLHVCAAEDLGWMLALTNERIFAGARRRRDTLGITEAHIDRARNTALEALGDTGLTRKQLETVWRDAGIIQNGGGRVYHLIFTLALQGHVAWGPFVGNEQLLVNATTWIDPKHIKAPEHPAAELLARYLNGRGAALATDFRWWSGLRATETTQALEILGDSVTRASYEGREYLIDTELLDSDRSLPRRPYLLPAFDEYLLGFQRRSPQLDEDNMQAVVPGNNGMFLATVVKNGNVVGTWKKQRTAHKLTVTISTFEEARDLGNIATAAYTYGNFLDSSSPLAPDQIEVLTVE